MKRIEELEEDIATLHIMVHGLLRRAGFTPDQSVDLAMFCRRAAQKIERNERMAAMGMKFTPDGVAPIEVAPIAVGPDLEDEAFEAELLEGAPLESEEQAEEEPDGLPASPRGWSVN